MNKLFKKITLLLLIVGVSLTSFANCFGKFSLTRKVYAFNEGIGGNDWAGKIIRTLLMYVYFIVPFLGGLVFFIDIVILNLIEFWTDSNPLGLNEYNKEGQYVKSFKKDGETLKLTYLNFGQKLVIDVSSNG
jgi:cytochrome b subunit of formate dehydrogenase